VVADDEDAARYHVDEEATARLRGRGRP
jgi:hypothetical protein